jgi:hypothetical protein
MDKADFPRQLRERFSIVAEWGGKTSVVLRLPVRTCDVARSDSDLTKQPGAEPQTPRSR